jgi:hypothetical protein
MCLDDKKDGRRSQRETERCRRELKVSTKKQRSSRNRLLSYEFLERSRLEENTSTIK